MTFEARQGCWGVVVPAWRARFIGLLRADRPIPQVFTVLRDDDLFSRSRWGEMLHGHRVISPPLQVRGDAVPNPVSTFARPHELQSTSCVSCPTLIADRQPNNGTHFISEHRVL